MAESRANRMYSKSPTMERGESGKMEVKRKPSGAAKPKTDMTDMRDRHLREHSEMNTRHVDEHKQLNAKHEKEMADASAAAAGANGAADGSDPSQGTAAPMQQ